MNDKVTIDTSKTNIIFGFVWKFMERGVTQLSYIIISLVLARLLSPSDYGTIALISVFVQISSRLITSGFSTSLIQKKDADLLDFSSVFYFSLFFSGIVYLVLYLLSPLIAGYYHADEITIALRVLSIQLFPQCVYSVQNAYVSRIMQFKNLFWSSFLSVLIGGGTGIIVALMGAGVWALVVQAIVSSMVASIVVFATSNWRPKFEFSIMRIWRLFDFGSKMLVISILDSVFSNLYGIVIGKVYSVEQLGIYNRGEQLPKMLSSNIENSVSSVALPVMSANNDKIDVVRELDRKFIRGYTYVMIPCLLGLAAIAEPLTLILLTEKWAMSIPYVKMFCVIYVSYILNSMNVFSFYALGKSGLVLKMQIVKKIVIFGSVIFSVRYGPIALAFSQLFQGMFECVLHSYLAKKHLGYDYSLQIYDVLPQLLASFVMYVLVSLIVYFRMRLAVQLGFQILTGMVSYLFISIIFRISGLEMFVDIIKERWKR